MLIVEQGARGTSYGGWLADEIQRRFFDWLDQPVQRVTGGEASPSISKVLERAAIARTDEVVAGLERVRAGNGRRADGDRRADAGGARRRDRGRDRDLARHGRATGGGGQPLAEIETEKAVVEYEPEVAGTVLELLAAEGDSVAVGAPIAVILARRAKAGRRRARRRP